MTCLNIENSAIACEEIQSQYVVNRAQSSTHREGDANSQLLALRDKREERDDGDEY
jgi:hypothetical protein